MKYQVDIEVRQDKIEVLLAALKVAESHYTTKGMWLAASEANKLNTSLRKQIFEFKEA